MVLLGLHTARVRVFAGAGDSQFALALKELEGVAGLLCAFLLDDGQDLAYGTGVEVRWLSPIGPLRLVWGYNPDPREDEPETVWDFTVGGQF